MQSGTYNWRGRKYRSSSASKIYFLIYPYTCVFTLAQSGMTLCGPHSVWSVWTTAWQAPPSMKFFRQEYWSVLPFPPPGNFPDPGTEPMSLAPLALASRFFTIALPGKPHKPIISWIWLPRQLSGKDSTANAGDTRDSGSIPGPEDHLEEEMTTHFNILAWKIPWTEKPGGL